MILKQLFNHFCLSQNCHIDSKEFTFDNNNNNAILHEILILEMQDFKPIFLRMYFLLVAIFFLKLLVNYFSGYLHFKHDLGGFNTYDLTFEDKANSKCKMNSYLGN